jgi:hypothetical protein
MLVQMLWTFGRFGYQDQFLMDMMHEIATKLQADCNSKALADVVYAMAQLGWADARLHTLVADYAMDNIQVSTPCSRVYNLCWVLVELQCVVCMICSAVASIRLKVAAEHVSLYFDKGSRGAHIR